MDGLRPGTTMPLDDAGRRTIREHWEHVRKARGQRFCFRVLMQRRRRVWDLNFLPVTQTSGDSGMTDYVRKSGGLTASGSPLLAPDCCQSSVA